MLAPFIRALARRAWLPPAVFLGLLALAAATAPWISPQDLSSLAGIRLAEGDRPPAWLDHAAPGERPRYLLGTDNQGRDLFSAILFGLRVSLLVGVAGTGLAMGIGVSLGLASGWWRGWLDGAIMRLADVQLAFPSILIALFLMAIWGPGLGKIITAIALVHWVIYARLARGRVLVEREKDYIAAARALGAGGVRIVAAHLLPNLVAPVLVVAAVEFSSIVMLEATLSFLGVGVPVTRPSLGTLIRFGYDDVFSGRWWVWLFPGLALVALVLTLNWLAEALRAVVERAEE